MIEVLFIAIIGSYCILAWMNRSKTEADPVQRNRKCSWSGVPRIELLATTRSAVVLCRESCGPRSHTPADAGDESGPPHSLWG